MTSEKRSEPAARLVFEYQLEASPQKVWRAISIPEIRAGWLSEADLSETEATSLTQEKEASYRMRETVPPYLESIVTFQIAANDIGGTSLKIIHELEKAQPKRTTMAANGNLPPQMRAA